jgi:hypothetical protein
VRRAQFGLPVGEAVALKFANADSNTRAAPLAPRSPGYMRYCRRPGTEYVSGRRVQEQ